MKVTISAVNAYLRHCATAVEGKAAQRLRIVMGNEASDLDSIVSAIFYASWLHLDRDSAHEQKAAQVGESQEDGLLTVPLINIPRDDFGLRGDALHVLDNAGIEHEHLLFLDDVSTQDGGKWTLQQLNEGVGFESVVLVDHNRLAAHQRGLAPLVKEVLDHHVDETSFLPALEQRNLNPSVGSACTLVAERVLSTGHVDEGGATALLTTILLDTVFFDPAAKRTSPLDKSIAASLTKVLLKDKSDDAKSVGMVQAMLYASANIARNDISAYSTQELLRKDYKQWALSVNDKPVNFGFASVMIKVERWLQRDDMLWEEFSAYCGKADLQLLFALCSFPSEEEFSRELIVFSPKGSEAFAKIAIDALAAEPSVNLEKFACRNCGPHINLFSIATTYSRKRLSPIITAALEDSTA